MTNEEIIKELERIYNNQINALIQERDSKINAIKERC